jgi:hypothetical protein
VNYELKRMWQEVTIAFLKLSSRHSPGGTEESHGNPHSHVRMLKIYDFHCRENSYCCLLFHRLLQPDR